MLVILVVSFLCLSAARPASPHRRTPIGRLQVVAKSPYSTVTGFWVDSYFANPSCEGSSQSCDMGTYGLCYVSAGSDGVPIEASVDVLEKVDSNFMYTSYLTFGAPFDCSGEPKSKYNGTTSLQCDKLTTDSWQMGYAPVSDEPWAAFTKGVVTKNFPEGTCGGSSINWDVYALDTCLQHADETGTMRYQKFTKCAEGSVSVDYYADRKCTTVQSSETYSLDECRKAVDSFYGIVSYYSHACNL